ncbi:hypothetical protein FOA52_003932 [Chlamydomonas sp. UWO 241]|nr:hypothetical protein FOA52_003932 [Chlamydomonas sp. UWO 241]
MVVMSLVANKKLERTDDVEEEGVKVAAYCIPESRPRKRKAKEVEKLAVLSGSGEEGDAGAVGGSRDGYNMRPRQAGASGRPNYTGGDCDDYNDADYQDYRTRGEEGDLGHYPDSEEFAGGDTLTAAGSGSDDLDN